MTAAFKRARRRSLGARRMRAVLLASAGALAVSAAPAHADLNINSFTAGPEVSSPTARTTDPLLAGSHSDYRFDMEFIPSDPASYKEGVKTVRMTLPRGLVFNPTAVPECAASDWQKPAINGCPRNSMVGYGVVYGLQTAQVYIYRIEAREGEAARFGVYGASRNAEIIARVTPEGDYAIQVSTTSIQRAAGPLVKMVLIFFAVPADQHVTPLAPFTVPGGANFPPGSIAIPGFPLSAAVATIPPKPFVTYPTRCDAPLVTRLSADSYENEGTFATATATSPAPTGCDSVPFDATVHAQPGDNRAGGAPSFDVEIGVPQNDDPDGRSVSTLKDATVVLPEGVSINPGIARDLSACDDGAFAKNGGGPAGCPAGSKVGTVGITTPLLPDSIPGDIYIGAPKPGNPYRLFIYAEGQGARIKLEGSVQPDPVTGRLTTVFADNPSLPFSRMHLRFRGGSRAVLALPATCGLKTTQAAFTPWSGGAAVGAVSGFHVFGDGEGGACADPQPFGPSFVAGTTSANAGGDTGFTLAFGREDRDRYLKGVTVDLPAGLLGRLAAFPLCGNAQAAAGQCSDDSLVGGVTVSAGAGESVLNLPGRAFLTEPPKPGQIAGLAFVVPAQVGPYDLGTVVVRAGIKVNRDTSLSVETDPLPSMLAGIPLRLKQVAVTLDRPGFMFNPTDCSPKTIGARLTSLGDVEVAASSPFQVQGCGALGFAPDVSISTAQPSKDGGTTGLRVAITPHPGDANMRVVDLVLPRGIGARLDGPIQHPCTAEELAQDACPAASRVGEASAVTPVLPQELRGSVHLLENASGGGLPRLAILLRGMVPVDLVGDITLDPQGRIVAHVPGVPDVPISSFEMVLESGEQAALTGAGLCKGKATAYRSIIGHNGKQSQGVTPVSVSGCSAASMSPKAKSKKAKGKGVKRAQKRGSKRA
jgi:hypothetical protein